MTFTIWGFHKASLSVIQLSPEARRAAMTLPNLLLAELRLAFQTCAKQHTARPRQSRPFRTLQPLFKRNNGVPRRGGESPLKQEVNNKSNALPRSDRPRPASDNVPTNQSVSSRELVPRTSKPTSVSGRRSTDIPMKIIPKAQITPQLKLTPKEQLQIEFMTRRPPRTEARKSGSHFGCGTGLE